MEKVEENPIENTEKKETSENKKISNSGFRARIWHFFTGCMTPVENIPESDENERISVCKAVGNQTNMEERSSNMFKNDIFEPNDKVRSPELNFQEDSSLEDSSVENISSSNESNSTPDGIRTRDIDLQREEEPNSNLLENVTYNSCIAFVPPVYSGKVVKVYDGDTITIASTIPIPNSPMYRFSVRLRSIDSAEIKTKSKNEKVIACAARDALHNLIFDKVVELKNTSSEKYGRILADVYLGDLHVNQWMLSNKYAVEYDGGTKQRPDEWK